MVDVLIFGKNGQLATELALVLPLTSRRIQNLGRDDLEFSKPEAIAAVIQAARPKWIINAMAYTAVDRAETEKDLSYYLNAVAPKLMAKEAKKLGARFIHYSTDYVFDGKKAGIYTEEDNTCPLNQYGFSKCEGEKEVLAVKGDSYVLRTSWVYSRHSQNFFLTMLKLARQQEELRIVSDQRGAPTWARSLAEGTIKVMEAVEHSKQTNAGLYHMTSGGVCSWYEFAEKIFALTPDDPHRKLKRVVPILASDFASKVPRPTNSVLSNAKLFRAFQVELPAWQIELERCVADWKSHTKSH